MPPLVSIITVNYRQAQITCDFLDSLREIHYPHYEVLLVDNGMLEDESDKFRQHHPRVRVINSVDNLGFAGGNNLAIREALGDYILLINNDTIVPADFLESLVQVLETHPKAGMVSPKIYFYDEPQVLQYAGRGKIDFRTGRGRDAAKGTLDEGQFDDLRQADYAHGACVLIRRTLLEEIGLLREDYFMYYEELDFSVRARRAGWEILYTPKAYIHHRESSSMGKTSPLKTYYMFRNRWLFIRRFGQGLDYPIFLVYYLLVALPLNAFRFVHQANWEHLKSLWRGLCWNLGSIGISHQVPGLATTPPRR